MEKRPAIASRYLLIVLGVSILFGLYLTSLYSYLLFHSLVEIFSIVIAFSIFIFAWNSRRFLDDNYLLFLGVAYLFVAFLDLIHTLSYTGMGVFRGYGANLPAQLWIGPRYLESISLLLVPLLIHRKMRVHFLLIVYAIVSALFLGSVFYWQIFPDCFVEGSGLTSFKKISEYIISLILSGSVVLLLKRRKDFDSYVLRLLLASIIFTIVSELAFTFYISIYGLSNMIGHYFKVISFYLIYLAIIEIGLSRPYDFLFRDLNQREEELREAHHELEERVRERTAELAKVNETLQSEIAVRERTEEELKENHEHLEVIVGERTAELRKMINLMADREVRMAELKKAIGKLRAQAESAGLTPVADDPLKETAEERSR